jgi:hypothetical protein
MLRPSLRWAVLLILVLAVTSAVPCFAISKDFNQTYPLQPGGSFELQNVNGPVEVHGWERNEIEIHAVKSAKQKESDLDRVSIEVTARPDAVSVATRYPQNEGVEVAVEYFVNIPFGARVRHIGTVNGTLKVAGVDGGRLADGQRQYRGVRRWRRPTCSHHQRQCAPRTNAS